MTELAPTQSMLDTFKTARGLWPDYERAFLDLIQTRQVENLSRELFAGACLLCSEAGPDHCHRRLAAEYLQRCWPDVTIVHL